MKVNRIRFDRVKAQWDILKMTAAYIAAEQQIIEQSKNQNWGVQVFGPLDAEQLHNFEYDAFGNVKNNSAKELIGKKLIKLEEQGRKLLDQEKYELFIELKQIYEKYKKEYDRL
jgi:hypothetical protein